MIVFADDAKMAILKFAIAELHDPELLKRMIVDEVRKIYIASRTDSSPEAFEVEIDDYNNDIFTLVDGSILEKTGYGYVGYIGYHEDAILYRDGRQWKLCVNDSIFKVDILKHNKHHYSRTRIDKPVRAIEKSEPCN